jgi:hypothetical protein
MSEMPSCFTQVNRKARKEHKCCECSETIKKGETYSYTSGVWDGTGQSFKQCTNCREIMDAAISYVSEYDDERPCFGMLKGWFLDYRYREFSDAEFLLFMANWCRIDQAQLNRLLKLDLTGAENG